MSPQRVNIYEEKILRVISLSGRALTTRQISNFSGISYNTTRAYLEKLHQRRILKKIDLGTRIYWEPNQ